ncbi:unnamed protein product [Strongylus vulgaris]|uniref:ABC transporter domain-containing protein n=1 Tax=Strongylus vulgaris TaxID=40348 RepID=A0A3P7IUM9_STRVU|nr:unnamed protein product [Strongylus vulgaris]
MSKSYLVAITYDFLAELSGLVLIVLGNNVAVVSVTILEKWSTNSHKVVNLFLFELVECRDYYGLKTSKSATSANFAGWAVIFASAAFGDFVRAHFAAQALYAIIDNCDKVKGGEIPSQRFFQKIEGSVKVEKVNFSYPSRPDVKVARNLNMIARTGQAIALVGASGCGKSTVIQLLERFYEPDSGNIKLDDYNLDQICRVHLRNNIALVGQEPILFKGSIFENVTLGVENVGIAEVQEACRQANAAKFIEAFPEV